MAPVPETGCTARPSDRRAPLPAVRLGPSHILVFAVWFGVLTGFCELAAVGFRFYYERQPVENWPELLWMTPVADVLLMAIPGALLALATWWRPKVGSLRLVAFAYLAVALACLFHHVPGLRSYTRILLALGLSTQIARLIARRPQLLSRPIDGTTGWARLPGRPRRPRATYAATDGDNVMDRRRVLASSTAAVAGLTAGVYGWPWLRERRALMALPPADPNRPNVLFIVLDTVRCRALAYMAIAGALRRIWIASPGKACASARPSRLRHGRSFLTRRCSRGAGRRRRESIMEPP